LDLEHGPELLGWGVLVLSFSWVRARVLAFCFEPFNLFVQLAGRRSPCSRSHDGVTWIDSVVTTTMGAMHASRLFTFVGQGAGTIR